VSPTGMASDHVVPQFYLKGFQAEKRKVWCYERGVPPRLAAIKEVACEEEYYSIKAKHLASDKRYIDSIIVQLESTSAPHLKTLRKANKVTDDDKKNLSVFIAHLSSRTPLFREKFKNLHLAAHKTIAKISAENKELFERQMKMSGIASTPEEIEELRQNVLDIDSDYELKFTEDSDDYFLKTEIEAIMIVAPILYDKHWHIIESSTSRVFLTSDHPVLFLPPTEEYPRFLGLGPVDAIVALPLSPRRCLMMSNRPGRANLIKVSRDAVDGVNHYVISHAHKQVFSNLQSKEFQAAFDQTKPGDNTKIIVQ
jgi:Protein of unknown function (DUF4238)